MDFSNPANLLVAGLYFVFVGLLAFFSLFGIYILIRYGKSIPLGLTIAIVYGFFFLQILLESYKTLQTLLS